MKRFFTADQHFGHANILKYEDAARRNSHGGRFATIEKMNEYLVDQWNAIVATGDVVYCLGDVSFKMDVLREIMPFLNGEKILIVGNHDPFFKRMLSGDPLGVERALEVGFKDIHRNLSIDIPGIGLVKMNHFPYSPPNPDELQDFELRYLALRPKADQEKLLLHGHVHSEWRKHQYPGMPPMINVGIDLWSMRPVSEAEIVELAGGHI